MRRTRSLSRLPLVLVATDAPVIEAGLQAVGGEHPLIGMATRENWSDMARLAKQYSVPLAVQAETEALGDLVQSLESAGLYDLVLAPRSSGATHFSASVADLIRLRELAIAERKLGYPLMAYPVQPMSAATEVTWASALTAKYASLLLLSTVEPHALFPLLTLRQSVYTDPTVPAVVASGPLRRGKAG